MVPANDDVGVMMSADNGAKVVVSAGMVWRSDGQNSGSMAARRISDSLCRSAEIWFFSYPVKFSQFLCFRLLSFDSWNRSLIGCVLGLL